MTDRPLLAIILAAGQGVRMKSRLPKVRHELARRPMVGHVLDAARMAGAKEIAVVTGVGGDRFEDPVELSPDVVAVHRPVRSEAQPLLAEAGTSAAAGVASHASEQGRVQIAEKRQGEGPA